MSFFFEEWWGTVIMKTQKIFFLFLAFVLPVLIFIFLKFFGKNEFAVKPLFTDQSPGYAEGCPPAGKLPYLIPDSIRSATSAAKDSLTVIFFGKIEKESENQFLRVRDELAGSPVRLEKMPTTSRSEFWMNCIFYLKDSLNVVAVDRRGAIRGQYVSKSREDIDRLLTEVTIILKKY